MGSFVNKLSTWTPVGLSMGSLSRRKWITAGGDYLCLSEAVVWNNSKLRHKVLDAVEQQRRLTWTAESLGPDALVRSAVNDSHCFTPRFHICYPSVALCAMTSLVRASHDPPHAEIAWAAGLVTARMYYGRSGCMAFMHNCIEVSGRRWQKWSICHRNVKISYCGIYLYMKQLGFLSLII